MLGSPSLCAGLKELEWCLFAETLSVVAMGASPRDKAQGQWWMAAQWAPYQQEGAPMQSCILVQTKFRGKHNGVPASSSLKGEPGMAFAGFRPPQGWNIPVHQPPGLGIQRDWCHPWCHPTGLVERGFVLPAYVTWQLETLEQEEQECLEVTDMVVACPLPCVLPAALGCALQWCPPGGCAPCKAAVGSLVSFVMLRLQLCPTGLVPIPASGWQLEWGVSHNASAVVPD